MNRRKGNKKNMIKKVAVMLLLSCTLLTAVTTVSNIHEVMPYGEKITGEPLHD